jgi:TRAP transporter TAXI family solute receptor
MIVRHRWLRVGLVLSATILAVAICLLTYRSVTAPRTLTVAVGSFDGDIAKLMTGIAGRMASSNSPVRLKVVDKGTVAEASKALSSGETELAIVRGDVGDLSTARTLVQISQGVLLIVTPPGSTIKEIADLKGKTVGVIGGEINHSIAEILAKEYDLTRAKVQFKDLAVADVPQAVLSKQVNALVVIMPVSDKYLTILRAIYPSTGKQNMGILPIESAGAIAAISKAYESYELPKGTIRGSPPVPDEDLTTLRVPYYLVANRKLDDDTAGAVTKAVMETRRDLMTEYPLLAQISAPSTEKDAFVPIHPGAAAYLDGSTKTFFEKYGDQFFYGSMLLGTLTSMLAGAWTFMTKGADDPGQRPLNRLYGLAGRIRAAKDEQELADIEATVDEILKSELERYAGGETEAGEAAALSLATHRLEYIIGQRRAAFSLNTVPVTQTQV